MNRRTSLCASAAIIVGVVAFGFTAEPASSRFQSSVTGSMTGRVTIPASPLPVVISEVPSPSTTEPTTKGESSVKPEITPDVDEAPAGATSTPTIEPTISAQEGGSDEDPAP